MIVAIYFPKDKAWFFKGWAKRTFTFEPARITTTPDADKAKDLTPAMADRLTARLTEAGHDALALPHQRPEGGLVWPAL